MNLVSRRLVGWALLLLSALPMPAQAQSDSDPPAYVRVPVNLSIVPGLSIGESIADGRKVINNVAINLLAGRAARLHGLEFGGLWNAYTEEVRGMQGGGVANTVGGTVRGAQFAGVLNHTGGRVRGGQFSGVANVAGESVEGLQSSGVVSVADGRVQGVQVGGVVNVAGAVHGAQIAGVANVASQIERGAQIGVVNVADVHGGVPIGLVSYVGETGLRYDVWGDESGMVTAALRSGNRRIANYLGVAGRPGSDRFRWGVVAGFGVASSTTAHVHNTLDVVHYSLHDDDWEAWASLSKVRLLGRFALHPHVAVFGGPTFNVFVSDDADGSALVPWSVYEAEPGDTHVRLGPGVTFGVRLATRAM